MKVIWIVDMVELAAEDRLLRNAQTTGADAVCIRTTNSRLPAAIDRFHQNNIKVYAWRWPAVRQVQGDLTHHYAADEADYVVQDLIPAGLDGYIVDPDPSPTGRSTIGITLHWLRWRVRSARRLKRERWRQGSITSDLGLHQAATIPVTRETRIYHGRNS